MLHDKNFTPLLAETDPAAASKKDPLEKIDASVKSIQDQAVRMRSDKRTTLGNPNDTEKDPKRLKVLLGTGNRIEDLLPKP